MYSIGSWGLFSETSAKQSTRHCPKCFFKYSVSILKIYPIDLVVISLNLQPEKKTQKNKVVEIPPGCSLDLSARARTQVQGLAARAF